MSNLQLPHDVNAKKDRISPSELAQQDKEAFRQQESQQEGQPDNSDWVPPGNKDQGSRKKGKDQ